MDRRGELFRNCSRGERPAGSATIPTLPRTATGDVSPEMLERHLLLTAAPSASLHHNEERQLKR